MRRGVVTLVAPTVVIVALAGCGAQPAVEPPGEPVAEAPTPADPASLVKNGRMPLPGLLTGGQPTAEQFAALRDVGYRTVINLRTPGESGTEGEAETVAELGMDYVLLPIAGAEGLTRENAELLAAALDEAEEPVLLHCGSGNRVGALLALKAFWLDGAGADEALELGKAGGVTRLEPRVRELLGLDG